MTSRRRVFYVYEHWRPDLDLCFWVGKGKGKRAFKFKRGRNPHYGRIVAKLARLGMCVEVRMVASGLTEKQALKGEVARIKFWRSTGVELANITDGGEGSSGVVYTPERRAHIAMMSTGRKLSTETRALMSEIAKARPTAKKAVRKKIAKRLRELWADPEYRNRQVESQSNRAKITEDVRANLVAGQRRRGKTRPAKHKAAISTSIKIWHARRKAELEGSL